MASLWPWLLIAGLGALHGLSPANGWMFAAACGLRAREGAQARGVQEALLPIAIGQAISLAVVAWMLAQGIAMDRTQFLRLAGALLMILALLRLLRRARPHTGLSTPANHAGITLWSFLIASAQSSSLMGAPALATMCLSNSAAGGITASGSMLLALAAAGIHLAAMLITTGVVATGVCRGISRHPQWLSSAVLHRAWTMTLALTGLLLLMFRS